MDFKLSEEHKAVQQAAREFAKTRLLEGVIERDTKMIHPSEQLAEMGALGFMGIMTSEKYGGSGMAALS